MVLLIWAITNFCFVKKRTLQKTSVYYLSDSEQNQASMMSLRCLYFRSESFFAINLFALENILVLSKESAKQRPTIVWKPFNWWLNGVKYKYLSFIRSLDVFPTFYCLIHKFDKILNKISLSYNTYKEERVFRKSKGIRNICKLWSLLKLVYYFCQQNKQEFESFFEDNTK